jgi:outer membrane protein assembly factor BamB
VIQALDTNNGKEIFTNDVAKLLPPTAGTPDISPDSGLATPTMCCDAQREYALFATGRLVCLDRSGKLLWSKELGLPENSYGLSSSLALYRDLLIVQFDQTNKSVLAGFDSASGAKRWETVRESEASWASPIVVPRESSAHIVVAGNPNLAAFRPEDGTLVWQYPILGGEVAPSPTWYDDTVYVANQNALAAAVPLDSAEKGTPTVLFEYYDDLPDIASPLAHGSSLYFAATRGVVSCIDSTSGTLQWQVDCGQRINASPLLLGRLLIICTTEGKLIALDTEKAGATAWTKDLGAEIKSSPAWHDGKLFIRTANSVVALWP